MRRTSSTRGATPRERASRRIYAESPAKLRAATRCPDCGATYRRGRWTWQKAEDGAPERRCPACEAVATGSPAGVLHVGGPFAAEHRAELVALVRHVEQRERAEHPLKRIVSITDDGDGFAVTTTAAKLAESMGRALEKAYAGKLARPRTTAERGNLKRVSWMR
ncbi:MAG TPA: BCAM0308 family protein [Myxococcota bacterium]|jgi:NMD protein affecting ribosome stability and mRNA decay|nr:BCAM0308 family protein [Myxococcota bacterium]